MYNNLMKQSKEKGNEEVLLKFISNCCDYVRFKIVNSLGNLDELEEKEEFKTNDDKKLLEEIEEQLFSLKEVGYIFQSENIGDICVSIVNEGLKKTY